MDKEYSFQARTALLLGEDGLETLRRSHVVVLGVGGVGAYAAEMLARAGVGRLTIVDGDVVEKTNRNRQLVALTGTEGRWKVDVMAERLLGINPFLELTAIPEYMRDEKMDRLLETTFDYAVDAIDSLSPKVHFILGCLEKSIPLICSMGSGGRLNPEGIAIVDISKTSYCKLARAVRQRLGQHGVRKGVSVVYSPEAVEKSAVRSWLDEEGHSHSMVGTISYLPAMFGCMCASKVIRDLLKKENQTQK